MPFAKSANGFAQDDKFGREAKRTVNDKSNSNDKSNGNGSGWMLLGGEADFSAALLTVML